MRSPNKEGDIPKPTGQKVPHEFTVFLPSQEFQTAGLLVRPDRARWLMVLAHGAGAGMRHAFMEGLTIALADVDIATFRYEFPYMHDGRGRPDPAAVLTATVRAAMAAASDAAPDLRLLAGGKSLGGRMTAQTLSEPPASGPERMMSRVRGLVFFGFPLHPPGRPGTKRAEHLARVGVPMLFLQGTRDSLADLSLLRPLCASLGSRATLHVVDTADHSFRVLKRSGTTDADVLRDLAGTVSSWADSLPDRDA
jgi:predicted alpha/beta-hydrolase family hydrolase